MNDPSPDPLDVLATLGISGATSVIRVYGGYDTTIWRVELPGVSYALRLFQANQNSAYQREVISLQTAAAGGIPVPLVHARGLWDDRPAILLSWCPGQTLLKAFGLNPWRAWRLANIFGRTQAAIHSLVAPKELLKPDWVSLAGPEEAPLQQLLRRLTLQTGALLHLDYHPLNVMIDGQRVSGVLDWPNALAGDPRADLARTASLFRLMTMLPNVSPLMRAMSPVVQLAWQRGYQGVAGPVTGMAPFYAWAGAMTIRDLSEERERPGSALPADFLEPLRRWTAVWKRRAGVG